jgi:hypothetical protein
MDAGAEARSFKMIFRMMFMQVASLLILSPRSESNRRPTAYKCDTVRLMCICPYHRMLSRPYLWSFRGACCQRMLLRLSTDLGARSSVW